MSEPTGSLVLPGLPNNHYTYITLLLLSSITAIKSVSGAAGGLDPWLQGSLPIFTVIFLLASGRNTAPADSEGQPEVENQTVPLTILVLPIAYKFLSHGASSDQITAQSGLAIALASYLIVKGGILPEKYKLPALGSVLLYSSRVLEGDTAYDISKVWGLLIGAFALYGHTIIKMEILEEYRTPIIAVAGFLLLGGSAVLPEALTEPYHVQAIALALVVYYGPSVIKLDVTPGKLIYMLLGIAFFFGPSMKIAGSLFEPYLQWILLATVVLGALLGATTNMAGPLRYGYASHSDLFARFRSKIPAWSHLPVLVLAFHPWTSWWLLGTALCVAWQYVREQHREHVTLVTALADEACNRAQSFSALAQAESLAAERYERVAHALAANITRDARAAHHVRLTDFYIESAAAWSKLVDYMNTVKQAVGSARTLSHVARDLEAKVDKLDKPDDKVERGKMRNVAENCGEVLGLALDLESDGQRIQDKVDRFKRAAAKATQGRQMQAKAAAAAWTAATGITTEAKSAAEAAGSVTSHLGEVRDHAMDAKTAIATGRISAVQPALEKVASSLKLCGEKKDAAGQARKEVQAKMIGFSSTEFLDVVSDPDPEGEDSPVDADPDSDGASGDDE